MTDALSAFDGTHDHNCEALERIRISELYSRYCIAIDGDSKESFLDCFAEGATWSSSMVGSRNGHQEIAGVIDVMGALDDRPFHTVSTVVVEKLDLETGTATASARWVAGYPQSGTCRFGRYEDDLRRSADGQWRFTFRRLISMSPARSFT